MMMQAFDLHCKLIRTHNSISAAKETKDKG